MIRIGAHLSGLERQLLQAVGKANAQAAASTLRLATGEQVQNAGDDPADLGGIAQVAKCENQASRALASLNLLQQQQSSMVQIVRLLAGLS